MFKPNGCKARALSLSIQINAFDLDVYSYVTSLFFSNIKVLIYLS
jgi:hypothetical protein